MELLFRILTHRKKADPEAVWCRIRSRLSKLFFLAIFNSVAVLVSPVYAVKDPAEISDIVGILANIIRLLAPAAAIAVFVMILVAGFQFLTSGGDPKAVAAARTTLTYAILGVILVVVVWLILTLIEAVTDVKVTIVNLPI